MEAESPCSCEKLIIVPAAAMIETRAHEAVAEGCTAMGEMDDPSSRREALTTSSLKET